MKSMRVIGPNQQQGWRWITLILLFIAFAGCRDSQSPEPTTPLPSILFNAGDRFIYDGWITDRYGYPYDSLSFRRVWDVLATNVTRDGFADVVVLRDSSLFLVIDSIVVDTLYLRMNRNGQVYWYGFLADLIGRREHRSAGKRWDPLILFGETAWTVGVLDSAGQQPLVAQFAAQQDYFAVKINNVSTAFPSWRIEMNGETLDYFLWASNSPACLPRLEEDPDPLSGVYSGSLLLLREVILAPRPVTSSGRARGGPGIHP
jgi:hypothetical protein